MQAWQATVQDEAGNVIFNPAVTVYEADGVSLASIFNEDQSPKANPFIGTLEGFVQFWAGPGNYKVVGASGSDQTEVWDVTLADGAYSSYEQAVAFANRSGLSRVSAVVNGFTVEWSAQAGGPCLGGGWVPFGDVTALHFGARIDGRANDSAAWSAAANWLAGIGGGNLYPGKPGVSIAQDIPIRERVYFMLAGCEIRHPASRTAPMFYAPTGYGSFDGAGMQAGGIIGGTFDGIDRAQNCIDFSRVGRLERYWIEDCTFNNFDHCYYGSGNDRRPMILGCQMLDSNVAVRVITNHPHIRYCDFRRCNVGIQGSINDLDCLGTVFRSCGAGIEPIEGGGIRNSLFVGCAFHGNVEKAAEVTGTTTFDGCRFHGGTTSKVGVIVRGNGHKITNCYFGYDATSDGFTEAAISIDVSGTNTDNLIISGNSFQGSQTSDAAIRFTGTGGQMSRSMAVTGNTFRLQPGCKAFVAPAGIIAHPVFADNTFTILGGSYGVDDGLIEITSMGSTGGNFTGNSFFATTSITEGYCLKLPDVTGSIITSNKFRNFVNAIQTDGGTGSARFADNVGCEDAFQGYVPIRSISGTLTLADNTAVEIPMPGFGNRAALIDIVGHGTSMAGGRAWGRVNSSQIARIINNVPGDLMESANNTVLTGTTGTDGAFTVSTSGGSVYFENRIGSSVSFTYAMMVSNA